MSRNIVYAIDFGTSNSLLAASVDGLPSKPLPLGSNHPDLEILRSIIYFPVEGGPSFGQKAISEYTENAGEGRFLRSIKKHLPSELFRGTEINNKFYRLEDLIAAFLREMKTRADRHFNQDVTQVVLGRPARFSLSDEKDRLAQDRLQAAAELAGFKEIDFFPEPLAAAFDYRGAIKKEKIVLIVDLGGGTSDFTVIRLRPDIFVDEDVLSIGGISVAGDALDGSVMAEKIAPHFGSQAQYHFPMGSHVLTMPATLKFQLMSPADIVLLSQKDLMIFLREVRKCTVKEEDGRKLDQLFSLVEDNLGFSLYEEIDRLKREVCSKGFGDFKFNEDDIAIEDHLELAEYESITEASIAQIFKTLDEVVLGAGVLLSDIDIVCCTGGTSKVPAVRKELEKRFGSDRLSDLNSFQSVIAGLARRAADL